MLFKIGAEATIALKSDEDPRVNFFVLSARLHFLDDDIIGQQLCRLLACLHVATTNSTHCVIVVEVGAHHFHHFHCPLLGSSLVGVDDEVRLPWQLHPQHVASFPHLETLLALLLHNVEQPGFVLDPLLGVHLWDSIPVELCLLDHSLELCAILFQCARLHRLEERYGLRFSCLLLGLAR